MRNPTRLPWSLKGKGLMCVALCFTVNDKGLHFVCPNLQLLLHGVKGDLLEFHRHAHERQQTHLGDVLLVRQA